jgi:hypothetical protein
MNQCARVILMSALILCSLPLAARQVSQDEEVSQADGTRSFRVMNIQGWKVYFHKRILREQRELGEKVIKLLKMQLAQVVHAVPESRLEKLREVPIWVDDMGRGPIHYHPGRQWLLDNGYNPDKHRAVDISQARNLVRSYRAQPWVMMHELSHAYHDRVLGFDDTRVLAAFEEAVKQKKYEAVLRISGSSGKHYALSNHKEYFAECTEAFFGTNDFYPFVSAELRQHDPGMYRLLEEIWGTKE